MFQVEWRCFDGSTTDADRSMHIKFHCHGLGSLQFLLLLVVLFLQLCDVPVGCFEFLFTSESSSLSPDLLIVCAGTKPSRGNSEYLGTINFPTVYGLVLPRILLRNNSTDLDIVHAIQDQIKVETVAPHRPFAPRLSYKLLGSGALDSSALQAPGGLDSDSITDLLNVVARIAPFNPPADSRQQVAVPSVLRSAGVANGRYSAPSGVDYAAVNELINAALLASDKSIQLFNNEWFDFPPQYSGNFHNNYPVRATIAYTGYLQLTQDEALYPEWIGSGIRGLSLADNESYTLTFSGKPPVNGF
ncbi:duf1254-domain-containing protein [Trichoderma arundinaceum]|uniref:Duf1254-domain-containing protein n=1 Tax=Trichoderma arundinaceum TaxID=490622 RepID=A0A395N8A5_TRIAR|nr:duf1254-domain-containing protein [Trichoderma arundinaceum]